MSSINIIILTGHAGADAEVREVNGTKVARLRVATSTGGYKKHDGTEIPERTEWHTITCWRSLASLAEHVKKGMQVTVTGRLTYNEYDKDGQKKVFAEIQANNLILGSKRDSAPPQAETPQPQYYDDGLPF